MSQYTDKGNRPFFGLTALPVLLAVLLMLSAAGCSKRSEEPTNVNVPVAAGAAAGLPKLIDLGATECIPCKMMAPILDELDVEYAGVLDVEFIDVWQPENKDIAKSYGITEIPTQIFFDVEGKELWRHVGFISKADILAKWSEFGYDLQPSHDAETSNDTLAMNLPSADLAAAEETSDGPSRIVVYYLFNTFRCATCKKVESLTKEAVLGTQEEPGPFAEEIAAGRLTFEALNIEDKEHEHFLADFDTQAKIPVVAEMSGQRIVRFVVLDKAWFLFDDPLRYLEYIRGGIETFRNNEVLATDEMTGHCEYITPMEAVEKAQNAPEALHLVDIRTPEEYVFIGHPEGARNIPVMFMGYTYDEIMGRQQMLPNTDFVVEVRQYYSPEDHLAILGQSGPRAALAVRILNKAGFKHLYAVIHGFQGEKQGQVEHPDYGKRQVNGWVNEGVPWTTALIPELMYQRQQEIAGR